MRESTRHFRFINGETGNVISFYSASVDLDEDKLKEHLENTRNKLAIEKGVYKEMIYWEEAKANE